MGCSRTTHAGMRPGRGEEEVGRGADFGLGEEDQSITGPAREDGHLLPDSLPRGLKLPSLLDLMAETCSLITAVIPEPHSCSTCPNCVLTEELFG